MNCKHWVVSCCTRTQGNSKQVYTFNLSDKDELRNLPKVLTEIIDLYDFNNARTLRNVHCVLLQKQKELRTCGYMAIAVGVLLGEGEFQSPESIVATMKIDESALSAWLVKCITNGKFIKPPMLKREEQPEFQYLVESITNETIEYSRTRTMDVHTNRVVGYSSSTYNERQPTSVAVPSAVAQCPVTGTPRLLAGCVISVCYSKLMMDVVAFKLGGSYKVISTDSRGGVIAKCKATGVEFEVPPDVKLKITHPAIMRQLAYMKVLDYDNGDDSKSCITVVYPYSKGCLSNITFSERQIHSSCVLELVPCVKVVDILAFIDILSDKTVSFRVRLWDIFPLTVVRKLTATLKPKVVFDIDVACSVIRGLFSKSQITIDEMHDPFHSANLQTHMVSTLNPSKNIQIAETWKVQLLTTTKINIPYAVSVWAPHIQKEVDLAAGDVLSMDTFNDNGTEQSQMTVMKMDRYVLASCVVVYLTGREIVKLKVGSSLVNMAGIVQKEIEAYMNEVTVPWKYCAMTVHIGQDRTMAITKLQGYDAAYDDLEIQTIELGGVIAYGGNKVVVGGVMRDCTNLRVCVYRPRRCNEEANFELDIANARNIRHGSTVTNSSSGVLEILHYARVRGQVYAIVPRMDSTIVMSERSPLPTGQLHNTNTNTDTRNGR